MAEVIDKMPPIADVWFQAWMLSAVALVLAVLHPALAFAGMAGSGYMWLRFVDGSLWQAAASEDPGYVKSVTLAIFAPFPAAVVGGAVGMAIRHFRHGRTKPEPAEDANP